MNFLNSLTWLKQLFFPSPLPTSALSVLDSGATAVSVWWCNELDRGMCSSEKWGWKGGYFGWGENVDILLLVWIFFFLVLLSYPVWFSVVGHKPSCQQNPEFGPRQTNKGECCSTTIKCIVTASVSYPFLSSIFHTSVLISMFPPAK